MDILLDTGDWDFPYSVDGRGRSAVTSYEGHVKDLVEQVLLTTAGERVMRPDFGGSILGLVFEPGGVELAATTQYLVRGALEHWLADVIKVTDVDVRPNDGRLDISVTYVVIRTRAQQVADFTVSAVPT